MKSLTPTLLALAALAPSAAALDVQDSDVKLGFVVLLQVRAERGWSRGNDGNTYNIAENSGNARDSKPDTADFYLRRFRFGFKGTYQNDYRFAAIFRTDAADRTGDALPAATAGTGATTTTSGDPLNRVPQIQQAYIERVFKDQDSGLEQSVRAGLDYAFFGPESNYAAPVLLFPSNRVTTCAAFLAPRGVGAGYKLSGKALGMAFTWGADVQNNIGDDSTTSTGNTGGATYNQKGEGLCYTTRLQFVPYDDDPKGHMKTVESFVGAPGTGVLVAIETGINRNNNASPTTNQNLKAFGVEALVHKDGLTALAEYRVAILHTNASTPANDASQASRAIIVQAGYAIPVAGKFIEPDFRWSRIDFFRGFSENQSYGSQAGAGMDFGSSGFQTELGVNWYLNKYSNKLQLAYQNWRGEGASSSGGSDKTADANIIRAQWQLSF